MEHRTSRYRFALACICLVLFLAGRPLAADEKMLSDFKDGADLKAWSQFLPDNLKVPGAKEPPVKIELSGENTASGKRCLKLTFSGGKYPTVGTDIVLVSRRRHGQRPLEALVFGPGRRHLQHTDSP